MQVRAEVVLDSTIKVFNLSVALGVSRSCFGVLDVQDGEKFGWQLVDKFFTAVRMDLCQWGKLVDPMIEDHLRHRGSLLVWDRHDHCYLGESIGHAQHMFIVAR